MAFVGVARVDLVSNRITSRTYQKAEDDLRIGVLPVLGPSWDTNIVLSGLEVHRGRIVENYRYGAAQDAFCLVEGNLLHIVFDIVRRFLTLGLRPPAEFIQKAVYLVLIVELVHEVRHVTKRLELAPRTIQASYNKAFKDIIVGCTDCVKPDFIKQATVDEVWSYQPELVLADTGHDRIVFGGTIGRKKTLTKLLFIGPLAGLLLQGDQSRFVAAAAKGLLYAVLAVDLGNDMYGSGSALIMLPPDEHTTKVAICRGTPKSREQSASHAAVWPIIETAVKKCGKQERIGHWPFVGQTDYAAA